MTLPGPMVWSTYHWLPLYTCAGHVPHRNIALMLLKAPFVQDSTRLSRHVDAYALLHS